MRAKGFSERRLLSVAIPCTLFPAVRDRATLTTSCQGNVPKFPSLAAAIISLQAEPVNVSTAGERLRWSCVALRRTMADHWPRIYPSELEAAIADKLLETKDWFAIKSLINKHATLPIGGEGDRPPAVNGIPQSERAAFLEALAVL
jgi:hypothetical protein